LGRLFIFILPCIQLLLIIGPTFIVFCIVRPAIWRNKALTDWTYIGNRAPVCRGRQAG